MHHFRRHPLPVSLFVLFALVPACAVSREPEKDNPITNWKSTDIWGLTVESYAAGRERPPVTYSVNVRPLGGPGGTGFQILRFQASADAPVRHRHPYFAWINEASGWIGKVQQFDPKFGTEMDKELITIRNESMPRDPVAGMPLEMLLPGLRASTIIDDVTKAKVELRREQMGDFIVMERIVSLPDQPPVRVVQIWCQKSSWWSESMRFVDGRKVLHAKLISTTSAAEVEKMLAQDINLFLEDDKRLNAKVTIVQDGPKAQDMLDTVQRATGVSLSLEGELLGHDPDFGSVQIRDGASWIVLKMIAKGFGDARWEHHVGGYRLMPGKVLPATLPSAPPAPESFWDLLWWTGGTLSILLVTLALIRRKQLFSAHGSGRDSRARMTHFGDREAGDSRTHE